MSPIDRDDEPTPDPELDRVLDQWSVPAVPLSLDRRVMASYRAHFRPQPIWRRFLTASVRIPLPVALAAMLLLAFAFYGSRRQPPAQETLDSTESQRTAQLSNSAVVTRTRLAGFQPVQDMNVTMLSPSVSP